MAASTPVALILGAGPKMGTSIVKAFTAAGYRIATVSRTTARESDTDQKIHIQGDFANLDGVTSIFQSVRKRLGEPSVVVYNAYGHSGSDKADPLSVSREDIIRDLNVNTVSPLLAAKEAISSFKLLPDNAARTFIFTGNILNLGPLPGMMNVGLGRSATAHWIETAAKAYKDRGYKFYYVDERNAEGRPVYGQVDRDAHGDFYVELAKGETQSPWLATFVAGKGYVEFEPPRSVA